MKKNIFLILFLSYLFLLSVPTHVFANPFEVYSIQVDTRSVLDNNCAAGQSGPPFQCDPGEKIYIQVWIKNVGSASGKSYVGGAIDGYKSTEGNYCNLPWKLSGTISSGSTDYVRFSWTIPSDAQGSYGFTASTWSSCWSGCEGSPCGKDGCCETRQDTKPVSNLFTVINDIAPDPDLYSVTGIPSEIQVGESFTVQITAKNNGDPTEDGHVNTSVLYSDGSDDVTIDNLSASWADYTRNFSPGDTPVYDNNCNQIPGGAVDHLVEAGEYNWIQSEQHTLSFRVTPQKAGTLWVRVRTTMKGVGGCEYYNDHSVSGGVDDTDQQGWDVERFAVNINEKIISFTPPTGTLQRGDQAQATVRVKNTGSTTRSFWVGLSFKHESTDLPSWPLGWYDIKPIETDVLSPYETQDIVFEFVIPYNLKPGQYYADTAIWEDFNTEQWLMVEPIYAERRNIESFSLGPYDVPPDDIIGQLLWGAKYMALDGVDIEDEYNDIDDAEKPLLYFKAEGSGTFHGLQVEAGGTFLIDLADLFQITPEGKEGWVTVWVDARGGLGVGTSVNVETDIGITQHHFDFFERALADDRRSLSAGLEGRIPGFVISFVEYSSDGGIQKPRIEWAGSAGIGLLVTGEATGLSPFEVNIDEIEAAFRDAFSDGRNLRNAVRRLGENFFGTRGSSLFRGTTWDDGSWQLIDGQWVPNLRISEPWDSSNKYAHHFYIDVPEGANSLNIITNSGIPDADLYVNFDQRPNTLTADYISDNSDNNESITINNPSSGRWYIMLPSITSYEGVNLIATIDSTPTQPSIYVTPSSLDFGSIEVGTNKEMTFTIENIGYGTLTGGATTSSPSYSIASGGSYSLTHGQTQTVTVRFSPPLASTYDGSVNFTGGGGDTKPVTGEGTPIIYAPVITSILNHSTPEGSSYTGPTPTLRSGTQPVTWSLVTNPSGMTIDSESGVVSWLNPTVSGSPHTITIRATNSAGSDDESWQLTVNEHTLTIVISPNGDPNPVNSGNTVNLSTVATDSFEHSISYYWTVSCSGLGSNGSFDNPNAQNPTWTAPENTTGSQQNCTIQVAVDDGQGLSDTDSYTQKVNTELQQYILSIEKSGSGTGMVTSSDGLIDCGTDCEETYNKNTSVTLTASADTGSTFSGWSGACSGTGNCQVTMDSNKSVTATFTTDGSQCAFAYISNYADDTVSVIDASTNTVVNTITVGNEPIGVSVNPSGTRVYVTNTGNTANHGNTVSVIDTSTNTLVDTIAGFVQPVGVAINPSGTRVYVTEHTGHSVSVIDTSTNIVVDTISVSGNPIGIGINPSGNYLYVAAESTYLSIIDTSTNTVVDTIDLDVWSGGVVVHPSGDRVYVSTHSESSSATVGVIIIDTTTNSIVDSIDLGGVPYGISVNPSGTRVYVANAGNDTVSVIDTSTNTVVDTINVGNIPTAFGNFIANVGSCTQVNPGWNLISLYEQPANTDITSVLSSIAGKYTIVWAYINGSWKAYVPAYPGFSDLTTMEAGKGYWINMTEAATLPISGSTPSNSIPLVSGWNLVGYNSSTSQAVTDALGSIDGKYISVWVFINGSWKVYDPANPGASDLTTMEQGYGYWINMTEAATWTLP